MEQNSFSPEQEENMTEQESLQIIQQMIQAAKQEQKDNGRGWIIWGWVLFAVSILTVLNITFKWFNAAFFWNAFGILVLAWILFTCIRYLFFRKTQPVKTYTGDIFQKLNIGFFISLGFIILAINLGVGPIKGFALLIALYGFWILIYGTALNFKPSIIGAYVTWAIGFAALFVHKVESVEINQFKWIMLLHALAALCGYIIPGHIANREFNKTKKIQPN